MMTQNNCFNMPKALYGSMNFTAIHNAFMAGHSAFKKIVNKKGEEVIYFRFNEWINDQPDKNGQHSNYTLGFSNEVIDAHKKLNDGSKLPKTFFGNGTLSSVGDGVSPNEDDRSKYAMPGNTAPAPAANASNLPPTEAFADDLPF